MFAFLFSLALQVRPDSFSLQSLVSGNWTSDSNNQLHTLFFIPIKTVHHYQALLNNKFVDIYIKSNATADVIYENFNFSINVKILDSKYRYAFAQIDSDFYIEFFLDSIDYVSVTLIKISKKEIVEWVFKRPLPQLNKKEKIMIGTFLFCCFTFSFYGLKKCFY